MDFIQQYAKEIFAILIPLLTWYLNSRYRISPKLVQGNPHNFTFLIDEPLLDQNGNQISPNQSATTQSHVIVNIGREAATKVEIVFNWKPQHLNIWPIRHYQEHTEADGRYILIFDSLAPKEQLRFELLSANQDLPTLLVARSDQCVAINTEMQLQQVVPLWKTNIVIALTVAGFSAIIYSSILLLQFLLGITPS